MNVTYLFKDCLEYKYENLIQNIEGVLEQLIFFSHNPHIFFCQELFITSIYLQGTCGGNYAYGKSAMEHDAEGLFLDAAVTRWKRGETAPVIFASHAHHWGK